MRRVLKNIMVFERFFQLLTGVMLITVLNTSLSSAQTSDSLDRLFTIRSVEVDVTARSASEARRNALQQVEAEAYQKLLRKVTQPEGRAQLPEATTELVQSLISGIQVVEEQTSSRRYRALLDVRFEPANVSNFLAQYKVPHVLGTGRGLLVLHGHSDGINNYIWQPKAETMEARASVDWLNRIRTYVFPRGALRERAAISFDEVKNFNTENLNSLLNPYEVQSALLILSEWKVHTNSLDYSFYSTDGDWTQSGSIKVEGEDREAEAQRLMYEAILELIDSAWRDQLLVDTGTEGELTAIIPSTELSILAEVQKRLSDVSLIRGQELKEIGLPTSRIYFQYTGRKEQLVMALRYAGLDLEAYGEDHILKVRSLN